MKILSFTVPPSNRKLLTSKCVSNSIFYYFLKNKHYLSIENIKRNQEQILIGSFNEQILKKNCVKRMENTCNCPDFDVK